MRNDGLYGYSGKEWPCKKESLGMGRFSASGNSLSWVRVLLDRQESWELKRAVFAGICMDRA